MTLSTNLAKIRHTNGLTLQQVAEGIGSSKSYVWELENGVTDNPGIKTVIALAKFYCISIEKLTTPIPSKESQ